MYVLGGNQRLAAIRKLGMKDIPDEWAIAATDLTPEQQKEFVLRDNVQFGDWDFEILSAEFGEFDLEEMGMDIPEKDEENLVEIKNKEIESIFSIIINFENEESLQIAFEKLQKEGYQCQISIL
jgi:ParB-like chromosome segregation protein Spo0J